MFNLPFVDAGIDTSLCEGSSFVLNASGAQSYTWNNGALNGSSLTPVSTSTYLVTGVDLNGCINTDSLTVVINSLPNVNAGNDISLCNGNQATLNASGAQSYIWDNGISNGISFYPQSTSNYTVKGTDLKG